MQLSFSAHTIVFPVQQNKFLLYQLLTRRGVLTNTSSFQLITDYTEGKKSSSNIVIKDISTFSLSECLLDNPNGLLTGIELNDTDNKSLDESIGLLSDLSILVSDNDYTNKLGKKVNLFDKDHIGNFHQQIGQYVLRNQNINAEMWWITQKFLPDYKGTTDTPYNWVQEVFMNEFFTAENTKGKKVLDFGCGIGYYTHFFHKLGGMVTGVDPSENYINIAKNEFSKGGKIDFIKASFEKRSDFEIFEEKFDMIFLSDVFLYYFEPYKKMELTPALLLTKLSALLNENGKIYIMDPHGIFHLQPWFNKHKPFLIAVEYANRKYRVTPNLEEVSLAAEGAGMVISKIREVKYKGVETDKLFYAEFPFWWFFELKKDI